MSALAIVIGSLFKMPEQRVSKSGKPYITASLKVKDGAELQWWRVTAFSETAQTELMRLVAGDALAVQGPFGEPVRPAKNSWPLLASPARF